MSKATAFNPFRFIVLNLFIPTYIFNLKKNFNLESKSSRNHSDAIEACCLFLF